MTHRSGWGAWTAVAAVVVVIALGVVWFDGPSGDEAIALPPLPSAGASSVPRAPLASDDGREAAARPLALSAALDTERPLGAGDASAPPEGMVALTLVGRVVDADGNPVPGATVRLHPSKAGRAKLDMPEQLFFGSVRWDELPRTTTDADGRFVLRGADVVPVDEVVEGRGLSRAALENGTLVVAWHAGLRPGIGVAAWRGEPECDTGEIVLAPGAALAARFVDARGEPIAGADLYIPPGGTRNTTKAPGIEVAHGLAHAPSDAEGRALLDGLWPGEFIARARAPGKALLTREIVLVAGQTLDLGDVLLADGGVIAGVVRDERGEPLAGVQLKLRWTDVDTGLHWGGEDPALRNMRLVVRSNRTEDVTGETGADGRFAFEELDQSSYTLYAEAAGREPLMRTDVAPGAASSDLELVLAPEALLVLRVLDEANGEPLDGVEARIRRCADRVDGSMAEMDAKLEVQTGAEAARRLGLEGDGRGLLVAGPAGPLRNVADVSAPGHGTRSFELPGVGSGERVEQTLRLPSAASLAGRVLDDLGDPVPRARLAAGRSDKTGQPHEARADDDGRFRVDGLSAGAWTVTAESPGFVAGEPLSLTLVDGEARGDVELSLVRGAVATGVVRDGDDRPATGVRVEVQQDGSRWALSRLSRVTDAVGRYRIEGIPAGRTRLSVPGAEQDFVAEPGVESEIDLRMRRAPVLVGRVVDPSGAPRAGVDVELLLDSRQSDWVDGTTRTDASGAFAFEQRFDPGTVRVVAHDETSSTPPVDVELAWDRRSEVLLAFATGGLRVRLLDDASDAPLADVPVRLVAPPDTPGTAPEPVRTSDADGRLEFERLAPGTYRVSPSDPLRLWASPADGEVEIGAGITDLVLRTVAASALVAEAHFVGAPVEGLELHLIGTQNEVGRPGLFVGVWSDGVFRVNGLHPGAYHYEVRHGFRSPALPDQEHVFASGEVTVAGGETRLDLELR
ncbi:MAG: carboxypeptidase regulatory-like domain-containing protein [Planctomycetes bacterium]|nr:carboxypeptidase regulatory-like domain-containing protein [Planctomycetota bacterium]